MAESDYVRALDKEEKVSYFEKLEQLGFIEDDDPFVEEESRSKGQWKNWSTLIDSWPTVEFGDIYVYLIDCPGYTPKSLRAYKSSDAYNAFVNGWVQQLNIRKSHTGHCIIRASVNRTQNISDGCHKAWVGFKSEDGSIISGHCTCMNGSTTICMHAVAIMFQVEATLRLCDTGKICTVCTKKDVSTPQENVSSPSAEKPQENVSSTSAENASVEEECKSDADKPQEKCDNDISILPETSLSTGKSETNHGETDSKELTYIECEGVEPGMIIILPVEGHDGQVVINQQLDEVHSCTVCNLSFATCLLLESHMETHNEQVEIKATKDAEIVSNVDQQESSTRPDKTKKASPVNRTSAPKGKYQCNACDSKFSTSRSLENHKKRQHKEEHPKLREEAEHTTVIETENTSKEEPTEGNEDNVYSCVMCSMAFTTSLLLESHMEKEHNAEVMGLAEVKVEGKGKHSHHCKRHISPDSGSDSLLREKPLKAHNRGGISFQVSCHQSGMGFQLIPDFQEHLRDHSLEKRFACNECSKKYASQFSLKEHIRTHTGERPFQCNNCGMSFTRGSTYRNHMQLHAAAKSFVCDICGKAFNTCEYLRRHMATHKDEKPFKCKECDKAFSNSTNLRRHMRTHTGEKPYACKVCGHRFTQSTTLHAHKRIHTGERPYKCNVCGKAFRLDLYLKKHMEIHSAFRQGLNRKKNMGKQVAATGPRKHAPFKCNICERTYSHRGNLKVHMKMHANKMTNSENVVETDGIERPFLCKLCGKGFVSSQYRDAHQKVHTGETPFKCTKCAKGFTSKICLKSHERTHTGEKPFVCPVCDRGFSLSPNLSRHMRIHSGEKPYKCDVGLCDRAFTTLNGLTQHQRTHTGEKPYKCHLCGQAFCENRGLKKHNQRIHNI